MHMWILCDLIVRGRDGCVCVCIDVGGIVLCIDLEWLKVKRF